MMDMQDKHFALEDGECPMEARKRLGTTPKKCAGDKRCRPGTLGGRNPPACPSVVAWPFSCFFPFPDAHVMTMTMTTMELREP
jgi:hypothetical protein